MSAVSSGMKLSPRLLWSGLRCVLVARKALMHLDASNEANGDAIADLELKITNSVSKYPPYTHFAYAAPLARIVFLAATKSALR